MSGSASPVPYPPIERHGVIGDRRTAALVAADGTLSWLCLPNYDGEPAFAALLDANRGGFWRMGPALRVLGRQRYLEDTAVLRTVWDTEAWALELTDAMLWPEQERSRGDAARRAVLRRLRCLRGEPVCVLRVHPRLASAARIESVGGGWRFGAGEHALGLWTTAPLSPDGHGLAAETPLRPGEEIWAALGPGEAPERWSVAAAQETLDATARYWTAWTGKLTYLGLRRRRVRRSAIMFHLLSHAPTGALVAAPTAALPERIGGDRNYDYRFAWVRDTSLALAILAVLGDIATAERYMDWLAGLDSSSDMPLQVLYRIDGSTDATPRARDDFAGYRGSRPVIFGNRAYRQDQIDSLGYLADCALIYLDQGGGWKPEYGAMIRRLADHVAASWRAPGNGIWELPAAHHHVSGKVMSWVALERGCAIAERTGLDADTGGWRAAMEEIRAEVMERGWSERLGAFRQRYGADGLDASVLLIPIMRFLPADHPRVVATVDRIERELTIDGLVYRARSEELEPGTSLPLGEFEGAFLPCTFWMAATYALMGRAGAGEALLARVEAIAGEPGLFAEEADPRGPAFLGNTPLLFSHAEYVRAVLELAKARPLSRAAMAAGMAAHRVRRRLGGP